MKAEIKKIKSKPNFFSKFLIWGLVGFLLSISSNLKAQDTIKNLIFEGAGIKGLAYAGTLSELQVRGKIQKLEKVGGTSAGAITALAVSLGYEADEIADIIFETNFGKFNQGKLGGFFRLKNQYGYFKSYRFDKWLGKIIEAKTGNPDITFKELKEKGFIDLYCLATLLDEQKSIVYSIENFPNMKVRDAVRASMTIPMYFNAMFIDNQGIVYKKQKHCKDCHIVVDGGLMANFPINIFDTIVDGKRIANPYTVGIRIDEDAQIQLDTNQKKELIPQNISSFGGFVGAFYKIMLETSNRSFLTSEDWNRTISVSSAHIGPKIKKLSPEDKSILIENGKIGVRNFYN
jgi:NTE family protein